jgi:hypothetical protein
VPNILVEMGFMTNPDEDRQLSDPAYQEKLAEAMASGVDRHFAARLPALTVEPFDGNITLLEPSILYERRGNRFVATEASLTPQTVKAVEKAGSWYRIDTWLGQLWVSGEHTLEEG